MWIGCGFCSVEKSVRRDGDWAFVFGVLGLGTARRDGEGEMCGGRRWWSHQRWWDCWEFVEFWNVGKSEGNGYGLWGRGSEKGRSWFLSYALCLAKPGPNCGEL